MNIYPKNIENKKMKFIIPFIIILGSTSIVYSQNKTIKGRVISEDFETLALVSIMINDTVEVTRTDLNGFFQADIPVSTNKLLFICIGLEDAKVMLGDNCDEVEVIMMKSFTYDFITLKKADRLRKKRFKQEPKLYKEAFEKGLFKTDAACYTQEFIPYYNKNRK